MTLTTIDRFVDGAAVKRVGALTYPLCAATLERVVTVNEVRLSQPRRHCPAAATATGTRLQMMCQ